jgi:hypothetical protein
MVWAVKEDHMIIELLRGGRIRAPLTKGIRSGELICFLMDTRNEKITEVMLKSIADNIVNNTIEYDLTLARTPLQKEDYDVYENPEPDDREFLWPDFDE